MTGPGPVDGHHRGPGAMPWPFTGTEFRWALERRLVVALLLGEAPLYAGVVGMMRGALQVAGRALDTRTPGAGEFGDARFSLRQALVAEAIGQGYDLIGYARPDRTGAATAYRIVAVALGAAAHLASADLARRDAAPARTRIAAALDYCAEVLDPLTAAAMATIPDGVTADA